LLSSRMIKSIVFSAIGLCFSSTTAFCSLSSEDVEQLAATHRQFYQSIVNRDIAAMKKALDANGSVAMPNDFEKAPYRLIEEAFGVGPISVFSRNHGILHPEGLVEFKRTLEFIIRLGQRKGFEFSLVSIGESVFQHILNEEKVLKSSYLKVIFPYHRM